jgi:hypothetical protein
MGFCLYTIITKNKKSLIQGRELEFITLIVVEEDGWPSVPYIGC